MLRILSYIPLSVHLISLTLILILRLPSFFDVYITEEEALYLLISKTLAKGGVLYQDAWFAGPPVMPGIYRVLYFLFGEGALLASRIFACVYLYIAAIYFNGLLSSYKLFKRYPGLPAVLLIFLISSPWYTLQFSASLFVLLPMILALHTIMQLGEHATASYRPLFFAGVWVMIAILASYKVVFFMGGILFSYLLLKQVRLDEIVTFFGGAFTVLFVWLIRMYFSDSLVDFWDIGVVYYVDRAGLSSISGYAYNNLFALRIWLYVWGPILLLAIIGLIHYRSRYFSLVAKIRTVDVLMGIWLLSVMGMLVFKWRRLEYADFVLIAPPVAFYATKTFDFALVYRFRLLIWLGIISFPLFLYAGFWGLNYTPDSTWLKLANSATLHGNTLHKSRDYQPVLTEIGNSPIEEGVWILADEPGLYHQLSAPCANRYTDFRIVQNKFSLLSKAGNSRLASRYESDLEIYRQLVNHPPDFIIERTVQNSSGNFRYLQQRFPGPLEAYRGKKAGSYMIYSKP